MLRALAGCIGAHLRRPDDFSARYGGEEFVAILPDTGLDAACEIGDCIRMAVEALDIQHRGSPIGHITVSIGIATMSPMIGSVASELMKCADEALYAAKRDGRNCIRSIAGKGRPGSALLGDLAVRGQSLMSKPGLSIS